jgi:hypothetical protein
VFTSPEELPQASTEAFTEHRASVSGRVPALGALLGALLAAPPGPPTLFEPIRLGGAANE